MLQAGFSGCGSCEKVGRWAVAEERSLGGASQFGVWGVTPGKFWKISVQICAIWCTLGTSGHEK